MRRITPLSLSPCSPTTSSSPPRAHDYVPRGRAGEDRARAPGQALAPGAIGTLKQGKVVAVEADGPKKAVVLESGERVAYDALVLATGSVWPEQLQFPDDATRVPDHLAHWREKIAAAKSVTLVGGGSVGIELAGEIKEFFPEKKVTIVHGQEMLLNSTYPNKFRKAFEPRLKAKGIEVISNDYIEHIPEGTYSSVKTRKGKEIQTDLVLPTFGAKPNTSFLPASFLTSAGHVKVRPTLQTAGHDDIFAAGDIIDWKEQKQAAKSPGHAAVVAKNVKALLEGAKPTAVYKGSYEIIIVTIGKTGGVGTLVSLGPCDGRLVCTH
ncbi:hypothetical protein BD626DRAFT_584561 [Schizophyllum amplum]|uniref:FAD/NAD(P)-binding domain-containing protein n=1 Tax=Schizophyllum amplum TaxID=97359 RepID=A0A550CA98_9AGAR|nr:hypothetical protein BD626DRAFT_584561 [Auriculariopsis ampla]